MISAFAERAISDAIGNGYAILKFISPNDVGITGSHQCGFYLPRSEWEHYTPHAPVDGVNEKSWPKITWQDGRVTDSRVTWYGRGTRSEYRLTRFGPDFPYLTADNVGDLLVLIPESHEKFAAYVLDLEEDIEDVMATLGVEIIGTWGVYRTGEDVIESENDCINRRFRAFVKNLSAFPTTAEFSSVTLETLIECIEGFEQQDGDKRLLRLIQHEYELFRLAERLLCQRDIQRLFKSIDDFLSIAARIMNRRKSRAGWSLEHHFEYVLQSANLPYSMRPGNVDGRPDVVFPGAAAYLDSAYPEDRLFMVGLKTTCKDRWKHVLNEARRIPRKYILTLQQGISQSQLKEMNEANIGLVVPAEIHRKYPDGSGIEILTVDDFLRKVASGLNDG